uniref:Calpain catalytic domain-containing protein n=1 Tax=Ciona savignyi TaxID=51511 RepID=H2YUD5_CIOSA
MDVSDMEQDAIKLASSAVEFDQKGCVNEAIFYYMEAAQALHLAVIAGSTLDCASKVEEYSKRIEELRKVKAAVRIVADLVISKKQINEQRAKFMVQDALEADEAGKKDEALSLYMEAADLCIKAINETGNSSVKKQLQRLAKQSLDRAEAIKATKQLASLSQLDSLLSFVDTKEKPPTNSHTTSNHTTSTAKAKDTAQPTNRKYTKEEIDVLRFGSLINGREYLPFMAADLQERFAFPMPYSDKHGVLELAEKQRSKLGGWKRPDELMEKPQMIMTISSLSIMQTLVSDCSFVASLAISAAYERKFKKKLITSIIYPQNRKGEPVYNPCGKYMVKLHLNGVSRKVVIDDRLPVDKHGKLLCSYSSNHNELWVSLVEKAYMKVMGGYDFPGSNSNIDLHSLTGWIPERQSLRDKDFDRNTFFEKVRERFHKGHCLATISTGVMGEADADRAGLVPTHAYAVLDVQVVRGLKLLQLKNPWSHLRWKGNYSAHDDAHWTPELRKALNYDNQLAKEFDNGVFWIDWDSALHFYDTFYINWNPDLFPKTTCRHASWLAKDGPTRDSYSLGNNPQYRLEVRNKKATVVWVLLTRHITEKEDFAENKEFITLLVYLNDGKKVYYPYSPPPHIDGVRINSPHYLTRIQVPENGPHRYTLVVSQYEKHKNIRYTLRVYSLVEFKFNNIEDPYRLKKRIQGEWTAATAGGCSNNKATYGNNPIYQINIEGNGQAQLLVELRAPKDYNNGFDIICVETNAEKPFNKTTSGSFRPGYSALEISVPCGVYNIIPCTFSAQQLGHFFLDIGSSVQSTKIARLK